VVYFDAVQDHFCFEVDYAQLVKLYGAEQKDECRYSPAKCLWNKAEGADWRAGSRPHFD
jgi:hypothetical protein